MTAHHEKVCVEKVILPCHDVLFRYYFCRWYFN